jgi:hypothetical protein
MRGIGGLDGDAVAGAGLAFDQGGHAESFWLAAAWRRRTRDDQSAMMRALPVACLRPA